MYLSTRLNVRLASAKMSTIRTWLLLANLIKANGSPLIGSFADLVEVSKQLKPISRRGLSEGIKDLEALGMVKCERRGNVSVIELEGADG